MIIGTLVCDLGLFAVFVLLQPEGYLVALIRDDIHNVPRTFWYRTGCVVPSSGVEAFITERTPNTTYYTWIPPAA